ncbi:Ppx/GppA family phosphatase [Sphingomonas sp. 1P06PA]|uniref:Ppx/GppA phosphatase family protein n=1 Tax=Sphingomonas sp. 1P06PA TaxID=554121 RepID=UPI0039A62A00
MKRSLFSRAERVVPLADGRLGIIDIGSNSIRLVVYDRIARVPAVLFNEKVMAGLGKGLARDGRLDDESVARALAALDRFRMLADRMGVTQLRTVATAAVREAANGPDLLVRLAAMGLSIELLSGEQEAEMAGQGVLAGIPDADGVVGDLGGGSLELIRIGDGQVRERASFPLGVLRLGAIRARGPRALDRAVAQALEACSWGDRGRGLPFYLVGGSWRALARLDMHLTGYPLPIVHHYRMPAEQAQRLVRVLAQVDRKRLRAIPDLSSSRIPTLADAAALLSVVVRRLGSSGMVASSYGLREGLIHVSLPDAVREQDPLIVAAREEGERQGRFPEHGDLIDRWIAPLFAGESSGDERIRRAACLLADVGWRVHPEFRAQRGLETALHGNWVGIDARGRGMMAQALETSFGGGSSGIDVVAKLCTPEEIARAQRWGLAIRLGQRLSGGVAGPLKHGRLAVFDGGLVLTLSGADAPLYGEAVERRHKALAAAMGLKAVRG